MTHHTIHVMYTLFLMILLSCAWHKLLICEVKIRISVVCTVWDNKSVDMCLGCKTKI